MLGNKSAMVPPVLINIDYVWAFLLYLLVVVETALDSCVDWCEGNVERVSEGSDIVMCSVPSLLTLFPFISAEAKTSL